jgi:phage shock protein PspC (stress-responsive transcriptional regulator)
LAAGRRAQFGPLALTDRALLRLALAVLVLLGALWLARTPGTLLSFVPAEQAYLEAAILGLGGLGLVGLTVSAEPLPAGIGLLLFLAGFTLFYGLVDPSLVMVVALIILQLTVTLVVAYLAQARYLPADVMRKRNHR